jgi:hypothetical protein
MLGRTNFLAGRDGTSPTSGKQHVNTQMLFLVVFFLFQQKEYQQLIKHEYQTQE